MLDTQKLSVVITAKGVTMSDKEKLDIACSRLGQAIKDYQSMIDYQKKWKDFALLGSVQSRKASFNRSFGGYR